MLCQACKKQSARIHDHVLETLADGTRTKVENHWCHTCAPTDLLAELHLRGEQVEWRSSTGPTPLDPLAKALVEIAEEDDPHEAVGIAREALRENGIPFSTPADRRPPHEVGPSCPPGCTGT